MSNEANDIPEQLRTLAQHMRRVADTMAAMAYYGGLDSEVREKALELLGAASVAEQWADGIGNEESGLRLSDRFGRRRCTTIH